MLYFFKHKDISYFFIIHSVENALSVVGGFHHNFVLCLLVGNSCVLRPSDCLFSSFFLVFLLSFTHQPFLFIGWRGQTCQRMEVITKFTHLTTNLLTTVTSFKTISVMVGYSMFLCPPLHPGLCLEPFKIQVSPNTFQILFQSHPDMVSMDLGYLYFLACAGKSIVHSTI